jgi:hypothetical protein
LQTFVTRTSVARELFGILLELSLPVSGKRSKSLGTEKKQKTINEILAFSPRFFGRNTQI